MNNWSAEAWRRVVDSAPEGIVICDAADARLPGHLRQRRLRRRCAATLRRRCSAATCASLQGTDRDQEARTRLAEAVEQGRAGAGADSQLPPRRLAVLERDGHPAGARRAGKLTHFVGYHRDASERLKQAERAPAGLPSWLREDRLTGLHSRAYFEELLQRDWQLAQRDSHEIGLTLFDIDDLGTYNEKFDALPAMPASGAWRA